MPETNRVESSIYRQVLSTRDDAVLIILYSNTVSGNVVCVRLKFLN